MLAAVCGLAPGFPKQLSKDIDHKHALYVINRKTLPLCFCKSDRLNKILKPDHSRPVHVVCM